MAGRADLVRLYGDDPIAFSTLQSGLLYCETSYGYIAYQRAWGIDITLGPPVAAAADRAALIERFLRCQRRPVFCYLRAADAQQVQALATRAPARRLYAAGMGHDHLLDTSALRAGHTAPPKPLQGARKHARRAGFSLARSDESEHPPALLARLHQISAAYLRKSQLPYEMRFLNRPFVPNEPQPAGAAARIYLLQQRRSSDDSPHVFGYAVLNPWFRAGAVAGYLLDILRCEPTRQWGVFYAVVDALCQALHREGVATLSLGLCPLQGTQADLGALVRCSPILSAQLAWMERHLAAVPYVQRLRELKTSLPTVAVPRYFVSYSPLAAPAFAALMAACGIRLRSLLGPGLWQSLAQARSQRG
jgi:lysylphosphatidylglycerol synthetase-like protein (DUF2156 family)